MGKANDKNVFLILGDQLSLEHPFLKKAAESKKSVLLMVESIPRTDWLPCHPQKLLYVFACMRRFAYEVKKQFPNLVMEYVQFSSRSIADEVNALQPHEVHLVDPSEPKALAWLKSELTCKIVVHDSPFFLADDSMLPAKPPYLMETFYRSMRTRHSILMDGKKPLGGQWNYDEENRKPPQKQWCKEPPSDFLAQDWTDEIDDKNYREIEKSLKETLPPDRFGVFRRPALPTHRAAARQFLNAFIEDRLEFFGPYEDAMIAESAGLFHSGLSPIMNLQILPTAEILSAVEHAPENIPLASKEGFIRQVIGWREFVRLIYLRHSHDYSNANFFNFDGTLPPLYWGQKTQMNCLSSAVQHVNEHAYSHHIIRLMVLGNFALLSETNPHEINRWFWATYLDAYEWVVTPNVVGMSQFADGGLFATKPYISGGNYINKMSTFCQGCSFDPKQTLGESACPFNALYWDFVEKTQKVSTHRASFARRMGMMWKLWDKKPDTEKKAIRESAVQIRQRARAGQI